MTRGMRAWVIALAVASLVGSCSTAHQARTGIVVGLGTTALGAYYVGNSREAPGGAVIVLLLPGILITMVSLINLAVLGEKESGDEEDEEDEESVDDVRDEEPKPVVVRDTGPTCTPRCGRGFTCRAGGLCIRTCMPLESQPHLWTCGQGYRCTKDFQGCEPAVGLPMRWRE